ncbi:hypothetical protein [Paraburkholderia sp. BCC1886]|uniref:hypothetical protein n=1 Tax=Paraburkholderia sp. BCC1886 TaxID=2562670 RepID=UPI001183B69E|nr:hypothetical protein [Paraburkholderia sp. BCC1886]
MSTETNAPASLQQYDDIVRPGGKGGPHAPKPVWIDSCFSRINESIMKVVAFEQHEYLENKRLPHTLRHFEVFVKPHLLASGDIIVMTRFPMASDLAFVASFKPIFENGHDAMTAGPAEPDVKVIDYEVFCYQEKGRFAYDNVPVSPSPAALNELKRQVAAIPLRAMQFMHFTFLRPKAAETFDDPNGYLQQIQQRMAARTSAARQAAEADDGPTPVKD